MSQPRTEAGRELVSLWTRHGNPMAGDVELRVNAIEAEARVMAVAEIRGRLSWETPDEFGPVAEIRAALLDEVSVGPGEAST